MVKTLSFLVSDSFYLFICLY